MASDLETLLTRRLGEIELELPRVRAQLKRLEDEKEDVFKAARAVGIDLNDQNDQSPQFKELVRLVDRNGNERPAYTMKGAVVQILEGIPRGLTANQILDIMRERFGLTYRRSSLSPQLSRLKDEEVVGKEGKNWVLRKYLNKDAEPEGSA